MGRVREEKRRAEERRGEGRAGEGRGGEEEKKKRRKKTKKIKSQKKEDPGARKGRKAAKHCVFPMICGSGGSKSRLATVAGAEPAEQMRQLHAIVARSTFRSKMHKAHQVWTTFGS